MLIRPIEVIPFTHPIHVGNYFHILFSKEKVMLHFHFSHYFLINQEGLEIA